MPRAQSVITKKVHTSRALEHWYYIHMYTLRVQRAALQPCTNYNYEPRQLNLCPRVSYSGSRLKRSRVVMLTPFKNCARQPPYMSTRELISHLKRLL